MVLPDCMPLLAGAATGAGPWTRAAGTGASTLAFRGAAWVRGGRAAFSCLRASMRNPDSSSAWGEVGLTLSGLKVVRYRQVPSTPRLAVAIQRPGLAHQTLLALRNPLITAASSLRHSRPPRLEV